MLSTRAALEAALADNPDDLAAHAAYADHLAEAGDPRGEYVRLQLALEDRDQPADRLRAMEQDAHAIRQRHEREWLGPLAPHVFPDRRVRSVGDMVAEANVTVTFRRGWVHRAEVRVLTEEVRDALGEAPIARLTAELIVRANGVSTASRRARVQPIRYVSLEPLAASPNVANLRRLDLGDADHWHLSSFEGDVAAVVKETPRLEHLKLQAAGFRPARVFAADLPMLQSLHVTTDNRRLPIGSLAVNSSLGNLSRLHLDLVEFVDDDDIEDRREPFEPAELAALFRSRYLTSLAHLALRLPGFGDDGVGELLASGLVARLTGLDLCRCMITDAGALALAACPDVARLEYLHLDNNHLTEDGIEALAAAGVTVSDRQVPLIEWDAEDFPDGPGGRRPGDVGDIPF